MKSRIDFVLVRLRDDAQSETNIRHVSRMEERHGADFDLFGSLITLTLGTLVDDAPRDNRLKALIADLSRCLGGAAKILHGSEMGHSGFVVGSQQIRYSIHLPGFTEARHRVEDLEWGQVVEFRR
ncbi:MAG: hypothetical protein HY674_18500 [Chloroflexi bacterium]|nr:hypothetical protein [Chloroflexota bacterium]